MKNQEIARIFFEIADFYEIMGTEWKPRAYRKAAMSVESLSDDITEACNKNKLMDIPGIGKGIAEKINEYITTGSIKEYERLKKIIPKGLIGIMNIPGIGPKKAMLIYKKLRIKTISELERAARLHKLSKLPAFKEKTEQNILEGIKLIKKGKERVLLGFALQIADEIQNKLKDLKEVSRADVAGSIRRMKETIHDIDILVTSDNPMPVMNFFSKMPEVHRILAKGPTRASVILRNGLQVDLRIVPDKSYGAALNYLTGSKDHNIKLRELAVKRGYKFNEYGLFNKKGSMIAGKTEADIYKQFKMDYIEPELRENTGEIEAAIKHKLPKLIGLRDIKGDFHTHSTYSDGVNNISEMVEAARKIGYDYICISDHSKSQHIARGLSEDKLAERNKEILMLRKKYRDINILAGAEVDILSNGSLDYDDDILKKLDIVVASVHSGFRMGINEMTKRICKAMGNEHVDIIGHPTGRLIDRRDPYAINFNEIFNTAIETNTLLEINGSPERLDLKDVHIKSAKAKGVRFAINTDSHNVEHLRHMRLGVAMARRGWCEKKDVINALSWENVKKALK